MQIFRSSGGVWCARMRFRCEAAQRFQSVCVSSAKPLIRTPTQRAKCALLHIVLRYRIIHGDAAASGHSLLTRATSSHSLSELATLAFARVHTRPGTHNTRRSQLSQPEVGWTFGGAESRERGCTRRCPAFSAAIDWRQQQCSICKRAGYAKCEGVPDRVRARASHERVQPYHYHI